METFHPMCERAGILALLLLLDYNDDVVIRLAIIKSQDNIDLRVTDRVTLLDSTISNLVNSH